MEYSQLLAIASNSTTRTLYSGYGIQLLVEPKEFYYIKVLFYNIKIGLHAFT
jgi:hypothetical protein